MINHEKKILFKILKTDNYGFTLLELVISLFIITLMISAFLANYNGGRSSSNLSLAAQQMVSDIRSAQNKALGTASYSGTPPVGGWGVHLDTTNKNSYIIFADVNGDKKYNNSPDEALISGGGQTINFPSDVQIDSFSSNKTGYLSPTSLDLIFLPPDPITTINLNSGSATSSVAQVILKQTGTNAKSVSTINILGLLQANQ
jgi:prepilin-type N-terminal cleavage/methylation domain-containing protein